MVVFIADGSATKREITTPTRVLARAMIIFCFRCDDRTKEAVKEPAQCKSDNDFKIKPSTLE